MTHQELLGLPIGKLYLSHQFEWQCQEMGFATLEDILSLSPAELLATPGFTYRWLCELQAFLEGQKAAHLLQTIPGRSPGLSDRSS